MLPPPRSYSPRGPPAKMPKKRCRAAADQAATTTVAAAVNSRAPTQPTHIALALRSETSPTFVLAWQRNRSANNGMLLPHHISPPILAPPCSCFASAYRIRLRQRCLIIATRPRLVCSESTVVPLSAGSDPCMSGVCGLSVLETHRISRATRTANVMSLFVFFESRGGRRTTLSPIIYLILCLHRAHQREFRSHGQDQNRA